jgi:hypothetical protein
MEWEVGFTSQFEDWWNSLSEDEQADVNAKVILLQKLGPSLPRPHADLIHSSRHAKYEGTSDSAFRQAVSRALCV